MDNAKTNKKTFRVFGYILLVIVMFSIARRIIYRDEIAKENAAQEIIELAQAKEDSIQDARKKFLQNSHFITKSSIKVFLKDPDSFDELSHEEYFVTPQKTKKKKKDKTYSQCVIEYTATNSFNARIRERKTASFDSTGAMIDIF